MPIGHFKNEEAPGSELLKSIDWLTTAKVPQSGNPAKFETN